MRTPEPIRKLSVDEMGIGPFGESPPPPKVGSERQTDALPESLSLGDSVYQSARDALEDGYAGIILIGPPGTSKSWYAEKIAHALAGSTQRVRIVQFHPSYQYEDFIQGWVSNGSGGFELRNKHFLELCEAAEKEPDEWYVLVIDEISRCDASRVFGEALTYLETSLRGKPFLLASGTSAKVPPNLCIVATMNPWDLTVGELDFALERRFAHINMQPSVDLLRTILNSNGVEENLQRSIVAFFELLQRKPNPMLRIGHAYFARVRDQDSLLRLWTFQLKPHIEKATRHDATELQSIESAWNQLIKSPPPATPAIPNAPAETPGPSLGEAITAIERGEIPESSAPQPT
jgi:5-methylcytosine-specific restriction protein B